MPPFGTAGKDARRTRSQGWLRYKAHGGWSRTHPHLNSVRRVGQSGGRAPAFGVLGLVPAFGEATCRRRYWRSVSPGAGRARAGRPVAQEMKAGTSPSTPHWFQSAREQGHCLDGRITARIGQHLAKGYPLRMVELQQPCRHFTDVRQPKSGSSNHRVEQRREYD